MRYSRPYRNIAGILTVLALLAPSATFAQHFERVPFIYTINFSGEVRGIDDTTAYAIVENPIGALYKWSASDGEWHAPNLPILTGISPGQVAVSTKGTLFTRTGGGLLRIPNNGPGSMVISYPVRDVQALPNGDMLAQFNYLGWMRSEDDGLTWDTVASSVNLEWDRSGNLYNIAGGHVDRLGRGDSAWKRYTNPPGITYGHQFTSFDSNSLFISGGSEVLRTRDGGQTWDTVLDASAIRSLCSDSLGNIYAVGDVLYRSTDTGATWHVIDSTHQLETLDAIGPHTLMGLGYRQSWKISLPNLTWTECDSPYTQDLQVDILESKEDTIVAGAEAHSLYRTTDHGISWSLTGPPNAPGGLGLYFQFSPQGGGWLGANDNIWYTPDWSRWNESAHSVRYSLQVDSSGIVFADKARSTNFGQTWESIAEEVDAINPNGIVYDVGNTWLLVSSDHADTWFDKSHLPFDLGTYRFVTYIAGAVWVGGSNGLYRSTNDGHTWIDASSGLPAHFGRPLLTPTGALVIFATDSTLPPVNVFQYDPANVRWNSVLSDTTLKVPLVACFDKEYLYVGDQFQGLWRTRIADLHLAVEESTYSQTREFIVPNPCSGDFRIEASTSPRNIHLFDILGRGQSLHANPSARGAEIMTQAAPGAYRVVYTDRTGVHSLLLSISR